MGKIGMIFLYSLLIGTKVAEWGDNCLMISLVCPNNGVQTIA